MKSVYLALVFMLAAGVCNAEDYPTWTSEASTATGSATFADGSLITAEQIVFELPSNSGPPCNNYILRYVDKRFEWAPSHELIEKWGKEGLICEVFGHQYAEFTVSFVHAIYCPGGCQQERTCKLCGHTQISDPGWRDE